VIWAAYNGDVEKLKSLKREGYDFNVVNGVSMYYTTHVTVYIRLPHL